MRALFVISVLVWGLFCSPATALEQRVLLRSGTICNSLAVMSEVAEAYEEGNQEQTLIPHLGDSCIMLPPQTALQVTLLRTVSTHNGNLGLLYLIELTDGRDVYYMLSSQRPQLEIAT